MAGTGDRRSDRFVYIVRGTTRSAFDDVDENFSEDDRHAVVYMEDFDDFLAQVHTLVPGCVVLEADAEQLARLAAARGDGESSPALSLILIGERIDVATVIEAMKITWIQFLERPLDRMRLSEALRNGFNDIDRQMQSSTLDQLNAEHLASLTPRERSVFEGLIKGLSNKEIAKSLSISHRTVEVYRANLATKLHSKKPTDWVRLKLGLPPGAVGAVGADDR